MRARTGVFLSLAPGMKSNLNAAATPSKEEEVDPWKSINTPDRRR
jgi:hypothetical protein